MRKQLKPFLVEGIKDSQTVGVGDPTLPRKDSTPWVSSDENNVLTENPFDRYKTFICKFKHVLS